MIVVVLRQSPAIWSFVIVQWIGHSQTQFNRYQSSKMSRLMIVSRDLYRPFLTALSLVVMNGMVLQPLLGVMLVIIVNFSVIDISGYQWRTYLK